MSSSDQPDASTTSNVQDQESGQDQSTSQDPSKAPLPLPEPSQATDNVPTTTIDMSTGGNTVKLDHMGLLVVKKDGSLSRISNWAEMSEIEKQNTLRVLGKRNQARREALQGK